MVGYYVSIVDGSKRGLLLGPYDTHEEALANVERGKEMAFATDGATRTWFYAYGTCRIESEKTLPKSVFGC